MDEFGSMFNSQEEQTCFRSIVAYMNNEMDAADGKHAMIENWFYWCVLLHMQPTRMTMLL